ncbi:hypothetical protein [Chitiniphilus eburneus]|uniref:Uncharacterized protein n=1 Tax=Chitiniphilus eburneus TaxID=2571148 RepID=A0A4U0PNM2_9NEIS|nr:hypothetical protein [Chitiniphilus eburneus]TJZ69747.1 hypothetical protein FAZ21_14610 [Chitiniphilus eburneus]
MDYKMTPKMGSSVLSPLSWKPGRDLFESPIDTPVRAKGYPLGFVNLDSSRDITRGVAQAYRGSRIIISGSSVTGESYETGKKFSSSSDIDVGVILPKGAPFPKGVDEHGFPIYGKGSYGRRVPTDVPAQVETQLQKEMGSTRRTGIRFFQYEPKRSFVERPHTPPPPPIFTPPTFAPPKFTLEDFPPLK